MRTADAKAAPVLALQIALVGTLAARGDKLLAIASQEPWGIENTILLGMVALYAVLVLVVVSLAAWVYIPMNPRTGKSLVYFEDIANMDRRLFEHRAKRVTEEAMESDILSQIHIVSQIASSKLGRVRWAFYFSVPAVLLWLALFVWSAVREA